MTTRRGLFGLFGGLAALSVAKAADDVSCQADRQIIEVVPDEDGRFSFIIPAGFVMERGEITVVKNSCRRMTRTG
jgi:hypothetical protein